MKRQTNIVFLGLPDCNVLRGRVHITLARRGGGGVPGLLTNANRGEGGVEGMLTLAGDGSGHEFFYMKLLHYNPLSEGS